MVLSDVVLETFKNIGNFGGSKIRTYHLKIFIIIKIVIEL
jgi:hypothetical protein